MTTIAWDGKTLAADRAAWSSGVKYRVRKVHKITAPDGTKFLVGCCGDGGWLAALLGWMRGGPHPGKYPTNDKLSIALVVDEKHRLWRLDTELKYMPVYDQIHACGAGQDIAIGALEAGATAAQAIRIAIKRGDYAGLGVDVVRF